jgi:hypothetical protein
MEHLDQPQVDGLPEVVEVPVLLLADRPILVAAQVMVVVLLPILVVEEVVLLQLDLVEMVLQELLLLDIQLHKDYDNNTLRTIG